MKKDPLEVARFVKAHRYPDAKVALAAGSIFRGQGTEFSDIDLVVLYDDSFEDVRRETIEVDGWPIEVFLHNIQAQNYFFHKDRERGIPVLMRMVAEGIEIPGPCEESILQKAEAQRLIDLGPIPLDESTILEKRYFISDLLDDLKGVKAPDERQAILAKLYLDLAD
ncbi:MAG TPA: nucleotidyltransferase domain-containing protein, partial [Alphaproteobacteria bacterium]|nr:nucleotidyltransferase domain-containing protein [Alphaproteobacteria bacterium]